MLPSLFPIVDWQVDSKKYPRVFLVDLSWPETALLETGSFHSHALTEAYPLKVFSDKGYDADGNYIHGAVMRYVIQSLAEGLDSDKVTCVSIRRKNILEGIQVDGNLPEALLSIEMQITPGDLVVINVQPFSNDSFANDELTVYHLQTIVEKLGGIVVISSGNADGEMADELIGTPPFPMSTLTPGVIIVGGVDNVGVPLSQYGERITCYSVVPYKLPNYPVDVLFGGSSAATAYIGGMVMILLNYANSKGHVITGKDVVNLLKTNGQLFNVVTNDGTNVSGMVPTWPALRQAVDKLQDELKRDIWGLL